MKRMTMVFLLVAGCSGLKMDGDCTYLREVKVTYHCAPDGKMEHYRIEPAQE